MKHIMVVAFSIVIGINSYAHSDEITSIFIPKSEISIFSEKFKPQHLKVLSNIVKKQGTRSLFEGESATGQDKSDLILDLMAYVPNKNSKFVFRFQCLLVGNYLTGAYQKYGIEVEKGSLSILLYVTETSTSQKAKHQIIIAPDGRIRLLVSNAFKLSDEIMNLRLINYFRNNLSVMAQSIAEGNVGAIKGSK